MDPDGTRLLDDGVLVFDGHSQDPTVEGPKFYKRNGYYYIFAPAGGVTRGWQLALRSKSVYGPYERKVVLAQGKTAVNGPHQGAWVDTPSGESWFLHFQDMGPYGRVVHLQPMKWVDDWPVMGDNGEPVLHHRKPNVGRAWPVVTPPESDEFAGARIAPQWQWQANPQPGWAFPSPSLGALRLYAIPRPEGYRNFWDVPNLLLQKFPAPQFTVTAKTTFTARNDGDETGLIVMGVDYAYVSVRKMADGLRVSQTVCEGASQGKPAKEAAPAVLSGGTFYLRVAVSEGATCQFSFSEDGTHFQPAGSAFPARAGRWIGTKVGLFALASSPAKESGYSDFDWFRVD
jgi:beta-xylosidase